MIVGALLVVGVVALARFLGRDVLVRWLGDKVDTGWPSGFQFVAASDATQSSGLMGFVALLAFAILTFTGFTTITNCGAEITEPNRNVGRTIMISIWLCWRQPRIP